MKPDRINYQKTFNLGNYTSERIGLEAQLEEGDNAEFELANLKKAVEDLHKAANPQISFDPELCAPPQTVYVSGQPILRDVWKETTPLQSIDRNAIDRLEILIDNAESIAELEGYFDDALRHGLKDLYNTKYVSFVNGK